MGEAELKTSRGWFGYVKYEVSDAEWRRLVDRWTSMSQVQAQDVILGNHHCIEGI